VVATACLLPIRKVFWRPPLPPGVWQLVDSASAFGTASRVLPSGAPVAYVSTPIPTLGIGGFAMGFQIAQGTESGYREQGTCQSMENAVAGDRAGAARRKKKGRTSGAELFPFSTL